MAQRFYTWVCFVFSKNNKRPDFFSTHLGYFTALSKAPNPIRPPTNKTFSQLAIQSACLIGQKNGRGDTHSRDALFLYPFMIHETIDCTRQNRTTVPTDRETQRQKTEKVVIQFFICILMLTCMQESILLLLNNF